MATPKQDEIKVRVTAVMKSRIVALATERGESESVIVREALGAYLLHDAATNATHPSATSKPARYTISRKRKEKVA